MTAPNLQSPVVQPSGKERNHDEHPLPEMSSPDATEDIGLHQEIEDSVTTITFSTNDEMESYLEEINFSSYKKSRSKTKRKILPANWCRNRY